MKTVKILTIFIALAIAVYAVMRFVNLDWWEGALKKSFLVQKSEPKKEVVEINTYKDKNGVTVISNKPVPKAYKNKAHKTITYTLESSQ